MRILALSGSLRAGSYNTALARAATELAPAGATVELWQGLGGLPHFDADLEAAATPAAVTALRDRVAAADAVLFVTPEYNGSVPGALKNAVDWLSRPRDAAALAGKSVSVAGVSPGRYGALWAQTDLRRVLGLAGARVLEGDLPVARAHEVFDADGHLVDETVRRRLAERLQALAAEVSTATPVAA